LSRELRVYRQRGCRGSGGGGGRRHG
jgi:hypothetical protein